jgi:hypothetical protein
MKRITISLEDDLYRIAKAYAQSEDISLSKAIVRMLRRVVFPRAGGAMPGASDRDGSGVYQYTDPLTGFLVTAGGPPVTEDGVRRAVDDQDERHIESSGGSR